MFPDLKLVQGYGLSETGFLTVLQDNEQADKKLLSCGRACPGVDLRLVLLGYGPSAQGEGCPCHARHDGRGQKGTRNWKPPGLAMIILLN